VLSHLLEEASVAPLSAYFTCQLERVNDALLFLVYVATSRAFLNLHSQVLNHNAKNLFIVCLEAYLFVRFLVDRRFELNNDFNLIVFEHNRLNERLHRLQAVPHLVNLGEIWRRDGLAFCHAHAVTTAVQLEARDHQLVDIRLNALTLLLKILADNKEDAISVRN
jgi:hypothetical protein